MRRAKLYYLRDRTGKSARIAERSRHKLVAQGLMEVADFEEAPALENEVAMTEVNTPEVTETIVAEVVEATAPEAVESTEPETK